jgi:hypothetical protein
VTCRNPGVRPALEERIASAVDRFSQTGSAASRHWSNSAMCSTPGVKNSPACGALPATTESPKVFRPKIEVFERQAYGFRNFQNYRLRVKALGS